MDLFLTVIAFLWIGLSVLSVFMNPWYLRRLYNRETKPGISAELSIFLGLIFWGLRIWAILHLADRYGVVTYGG